MIGSEMEQLYQLDQAQIVVFLHSRTVDLVRVSGLEG